MTLLDTIADVKVAVTQQKQSEDNLRRKMPLIRFWDSEWQLQHLGGVEVKAQFAWISNDTGPAQITLPFDSPVAQWIHDTEGRVARGEGRTVGLTVDHCGARWSGIMDKYTIDSTADGDVTLTVDFSHDYEHLKFVSIYSNPFFAPAFQLPRAWVCAGPLTWALKVTLLANLARQHDIHYVWPDDPMDKAGHLTRYNAGWIDQSQWPMAVNPGSFAEAVESGVVWGICTSRFATWHDMAHVLLENSELSVRCDRWIEGDPDPWYGYTPRNGQLIIDIVDKSGTYVGTSHGGDLWDGLKRTVVEFADDFVDSTQQLIADAPTPVDYYKPGSKFTAKEKPYVVFREGETSPIQSSQWIHSPSKGISVIIGGHSMPGINEIVSASIQGLGSLLGGLIMIGSLGSIWDTLLKPLYEDTILAWEAHKSPQRDINTGWDRLYEHFQQGANNAFTIAGLLVLRAGMWATKTTVSWKCAVADGLPYLIGDNRTPDGESLGHFFLDDRVGLVVTGDDQIHMDRCRKIDLKWDEETPPEWLITIGDDRILQDPAQRALGRIEAIIAGMRDLGVY
jgi:hypothetical protein